MRFCRPFGVALVGAVMVVAPLSRGGHPALAQATPAPQATAAQAASLAQGWAFLRAGDIADAARAAARVLAADPGNAAALALSVEAAIAGGGARAGLTVYEQWLGARRLDDPYAIRRVAVAYLREALRDPAGKTAALKALAADGDADALAELAAAASSGKPGETAALASLGDARAVRSLIASLDALPSARVNTIEALARTGSRDAIPPLVALLDDRSDETRAAAAEALGRLNATDAIDALRRILTDPLVIYSPLKWKAAAALSRLHDVIGVLYLRNIMMSPDAAAHPELKVAAAADIAPYGSEREWIDEIRPLVAHADPKIRLRAASLLAPYGDQNAKAALEALLQDANPAIRELSAEALATRVTGDFALLRRLIRTTDIKLRTQVAARILELTR